MKYEYEIGMELTIPTLDELAEHFGLDENGDINTINKIKRARHEADYCGKTFTIVSINTYKTYKTFKFKWAGHTHAWFSSDVFEFKTKVNKITKGTIMKKQVGDTIFIPPFNAIAEHFGTTNYGSTETKYSIENSGGMFDMCGHEHQIIEIDQETGYLLENKISGQSWWFTFDVFEFGYTEDERNNKEYVGVDKTININTTITNQIKHRYELIYYDYLTHYEVCHGIIDTLYPYSKLNQEKRKVTTIRKGRKGQYAISEKIAKDFEVPQLKIEDLIEILGYSKEHITTILNKVKNKGYNIAVVGYGGTGTNFLHWLSQLALMTNIEHIFNGLILADDDYFDTVNILRIPFVLPELGRNTLQKKVRYFQDYANVFNHKNIIPDNITKDSTYSDYIHYGAPDLETRKMFHDKGTAFVSATHRNEDCALMLRPDLDTELMVETYGKISLTTFFLNHIKMTISFLEFLSKDETTWDVLTGEEKSILNYNFIEENEDICYEPKNINGKLLMPIIARADNRRDIA